MLRKLLLAAKLCCCFILTFAVTSIVFVESYNQKQYGVTIKPPAPWTVEHIYYDGVPDRFVTRC